MSQSCSERPSEQAKPGLARVWGEVKDMHNNKKAAGPEAQAQSRLPKEPVDTDGLKYNIAIVISIISLLLSILGAWPN